MLCAVGLYVAARRDVVLQARLGEEADGGRQVVLQAEARANRPLPRGADGGLVGGFILAIHEVVGTEC